MIKPTGRKGAAGEVSRSVDLPLVPAGAPAVIWTCNMQKDRHPKVTVPGSAYVSSSHPPAGEYSLAHRASNSSGHSQLASQ